MIKIHYEKISEKRKQFGYKQGNIADMSGINVQTTISRIENGDKNIKLEDFCKVIDILELPFDEIVEIRKDAHREFIYTLNKYRNNADYTKMFNFMKRKNIREWQSNLELSVYYNWHYGIYYGTKCEYTKADKYLDKALQLIYDANQYKHLLPEIYITKGQVALSTDRNSVKYFKKAEDLFQLSSTKENYKYIVRMKYNFACAYCFSEKYTLALSHINHAIKELNKYDSNYLRLNLEESKCKIYEKTENPAYEDQKAAFLIMKNKLEIPSN